jgi:hypothetical protein
MASTLVAMLLGGVVLAKTREDVAPLRSAIAVMMAYAESFEAADGGS